MTNFESYNFHIWEISNFTIFIYGKNVYHRDFIQFSVRMELYEKKFRIYENYMIRSFGQPGCLVLPVRIAILFIS